MILLWFPVAIDDIFIPEVAPDLLAGLIGLSAEDGQITITLAACEAEADLMRN